MVKLTPQARQNIKDMRKAIKAADRALDTSGSEYEPSRKISSDSVPLYIPYPENAIHIGTPPSSPDGQASINISSGSSEGSAAGSGDEYSTSPTASISGEGVRGDEEDGKLPGGGVPQVGVLTGLGISLFGRIDSSARQRSTSLGNDGQHEN